LSCIYVFVVVKDSMTLRWFSFCHENSYT